MAPNDDFSSNKKIKRSASAECIGMEKIEASIPHYQLRRHGLSEHSKKAVSNDTANAATAGQGNLRDNNIQKTDTVPSPILKPSEAAGVNLAELSGQQLVGRKVKIWWPEEKMFHPGKITVFNEELGMHMVHYDNDINELVDLDKERWQLVKEEDIVAGPSNTKIRRVEMNSCPALKRKVTFQEIIHEGQKKKFAETVLNSNEDLTVNPKAAPAGPKLAGSHNEFVDVSGYQVKANFALTLRSIFSKYGDIACDCPFPSMRIGFLEEVCNVVEKLRSTESGFTSSQLEEMNRVISLAAMANLNVSWLQSFLRKINPVDEVATVLRTSTYRLVQAAAKDVDDWKRGLMEAEKRLEALVRQYAKMERDDVAAKQAFTRSVDELV